MATGTSPCRRRLSRDGARRRSAERRDAGRRVPGTGGTETVLARLGITRGRSARARRCCARGNSAGGALRSPGRALCAPVSGSAITNPGDVLRRTWFGARSSRCGLVLALWHRDALELLDGLTPQDPLRVALPDHGRGDAAGQAVQLSGVVEDVLEGVSAFRVAHPRARYELWGETYKPGVEEVLARARLAGH